MSHNNFLNLLQNEVDNWMDINKNVKTNSTCSHKKPVERITLVQRTEQFNEMQRKLRNKIQRKGTKRFKSKFQDGLKKVDTTILQKSESFMYKYTILEKKNIMLKKEVKDAVSQLTHTLQEVRTTESEKKQYETMIDNLRTDWEKDVSYFEKEKELMENTITLYEDRIKVLESNQKLERAQNIQTEQELGKAQRAVKHLNTVLMNFKRKNQIVKQEQKGNHDNLRMNSRGDLKAEKMMENGLLLEDCEKQIKVLRQQCKTLRESIDDLQMKALTRDRIFGCIRNALKNERALKTTFQERCCAQQKEIEYMRLQKYKLLTELQLRIQEKKSKMKALKPKISEKTLSPYVSDKVALTNNSIETLTNTLKQTQDRLDLLLTGSDCTVKSRLQSRIESKITTTVRQFDLDDDNKVTYKCVKRFFSVSTLSTDVKKYSLSFLLVFYLCAMHVWLMSTRFI